MPSMETTTLKRRREMSNKKPNIWTEPNPVAGIIIRLLLLTVFLLVVFYGLRILF